MAREHGTLCMECSAVETSCDLLPSQAEGAGCAGDYPGSGPLATLGEESMSPGEPSFSGTRARLVWQMMKEGWQHLTGQL